MAFLKASLHPKYAHDLKVVSSTKFDMSNAEQQFYTSIEVGIIPHHTGHSPEVDTAASLVTLDPHVKEFIKDRARVGKQPICCIASDIGQFSMNLTQGLNVSDDNRKFYPSDHDVGRIVRLFRQDLDPQNRISVQKFIDKDKAANPGDYFAVACMLNFAEACMKSFSHLLARAKYCLLSFLIDYKQQVDVQAW